jgi:hypothetical protein
MTTLTLDGLGSGAGAGRRGRKSYAKDAKENREKNKTKMRMREVKSGLGIQPNLYAFFGIFLRPLRNFCVLCVRKSAFALTTTTHPTGRTAQ